MVQIPKDPVLEPDRTVDTRAAQQQSGVNSQTSHVPAGLVNSSQINPATISSNHCTFPLSPSIPAQSSSPQLKLPEAHDADPAVERTDRRPRSIKEDARGTGEVALPNFETFPTDCDRASPTSRATPCHTPSYLPGERELSPSPQVSSAQQSPFASPSLQQRTQSLTGSAVDVIRASSPPFSSPQSLSPLSPFPPSLVSGSSALDTHCGDVSNGMAAAPDAPAGSSDHRSTCIESFCSDPAPSQPVDNARIDSDQPDPLKAHGIAFHDESDFVGSADGPSPPQRRLSNGQLVLGSTAEHRAALPLSPAKTPRCEDSAVDLARTRKRMRKSALETKNEPSRKARKIHKRSSVKDCTVPGPLCALIDQIGRRGKTADIQEIVRELKTRPHRPPGLTPTIYSRIPIRSDTTPLRIIRAIPNLAGEIEASTINEQLSRVHNRIALADFYCAYRAAQAKPDEFLQELARNAPHRRNPPRAPKGTRRAEVKECFIELVFCRSVGQRNRGKDSTRVNNWQSWGRPWFELINRFGTGFLLLIPDDVTNRRLRELKKEEFSDFLKLVEQREPEFRDNLAAANDLVNGMFFNSDPDAEIARGHSNYRAVSSRSGLNFSAGIASVPPANHDDLRAANFAEGPAFTPDALSQDVSPLEEADAFSGPDLDALLTSSFRQAAESRQRNGIFGQCYLWQSIRFDDPEGIDGRPEWWPRVQRSHRQPSRYQILPFFYSQRWQLAIFDIAENLVVCYDSVWTLGSPNSTFALLQHWFDQTDTPVANTAKDTVVVTWWLACQIIAGDEVTDRSIDWQSETALADRILSDREETICQTVETSLEELVSPSIHSGVERAY
ncbi:uncharacterized protein KY384_003270 [Bacidia gigantensis]|uniref:uncharacterized protein n=1 Tax=Bacidia gigantensis TaxID=2732470 RepID=UPI001D04A193|nr:uncharacterized protein KY384_003270 [Bacidia gigantensis]KAG8531639.1 hypothetical protein KY384_003270 [Bacidia gigantensis]